MEKHRWCSSGDTVDSYLACDCSDAEVDPSAAWAVELDLASWTDILMRLIQNGLNIDCCPNKPKLSCCCHYWHAMWTCSKRYAATTKLLNSAFVLGLASSAIHATQTCRNSTDVGQANKNNGNICMCRYNKALSAHANDKNCFLPAVFRLHSMQNRVACKTA